VTRSVRLGGAYTVLRVRVSILVGIFTAVNSRAVKCGKFGLFC
jgi:hypothetical protein